MPSHSKVGPSRLMLTSLLAAVACANFAGCAASYVPPQSNAKARLRIVVDRPPSKYSTLAGVFTAPSCDAAGGGRVAAFTSTEGLPQAKPRQTLGMLGTESIPQSLKHEFEIPVGPAFTFIISEQGSEGLAPVQTSADLTFLHTSCAVTLSFVPDLNEQYEAHYSYNRGTSSCSVRFSRLLKSTQGEAVVRVDQPAQRLECKYPGAW